MKPLTTYLLPAGVAALLFAGAVVAQATGPGVVSDENVLANPGAERSAGVAPEDATGVLTPSDWQTWWFHRCRVREQWELRCLADERRRPTGRRGSNYFAGGPGKARATATQTVDVSSNATMIDIGKVTAHLSAYLGGWSTQDDSMTVSTIFRLASGKATKGSRSAQ